MCILYVYRYTLLLLYVISMLKPYISKSIKNLSSQSIKKEKITNKEFKNLSTKKLQTYTITTSRALNSTRFWNSSSPLPHHSKKSTIFDFHLFLNVSMCICRYLYICTPITAGSNGFHKSKSKRLTTITIYLQHVSSLYIPHILYVRQ